MRLWLGILGIAAGALLVTEAVMQPTAGTTLPSIGWDFRGLAEHTNVDVPLISAGVLFFPDEVELDEKEREYVLRFNSAWDIKGVETVLRIPIDAMNAMNLEQPPAGNAPKPAPEK